MQHPIFQLMQCVAAPQSSQAVGKWWLLETYLTSDGPRSRVIPVPGGTEAEAHAELDRRVEMVRAHAKPVPAEPQFPTITYVDRLAPNERSVGGLRLGLSCGHTTDVQTMTANYRPGQSLGVPCPKCPAPK